LTGSQEVTGSTPVGSTFKTKQLQVFTCNCFFYQSRSLKWSNSTILKKRKTLLQTILLNSL